MAVNYILTQKGNPGNPEAPKKFYAQANFESPPVILKSRRAFEEKAAGVLEKAGKQKH